MRGINDNLAGLSGLNSAYRNNKDHNKLKAAWNDIEKMADDIEKAIKKEENK